MIRIFSHFIHVYSTKEQKQRALILMSPEAELFARSYYIDFTIADPPLCTRTVLLRHRKRLDAREIHKQIYFLCLKASAVAIILKTIT